MNIQHINYLLEVFRTGSISKAAANLYVAQPNLSNAIKSIEQEIGFPVFIRTTKGIIPTESGLRVLAEAGKMKESYESMLKANLSGNSKKIRIGGLNYTPVCDAFFKLCEEQKMDNRIEFDYSVLDGQSLMEKLFLSQLDIAVTSLDPSVVGSFVRQAEQKGIHAEIVGDIAMALRIGPSHPLFDKPNLEAKDLESTTFVDYNGRNMVNNSALQNYIKIDPNNVVTVHDRYAKDLMIRDYGMYGIGGALPKARNDEFKFRTILLGDMRHTILVLQNTSSRSNEIAARFTELLKEELTSL